MSEERWATLWLIVTVACMVALGVFLASVKITPSYAHDGDHNHDAWYSELTQPDNPTVSCCGLADAYWCDTINVKDGETSCTITDDRDDAPLGRPHVDIGTQIHIPNSKLKWQQGGEPIGNPTGHTIVFLSYTRQAYCLVQAGGV